MFNKTKEFIEILTNTGKGRYVRVETHTNLADEMGKRLVKKAITNGVTIPTVTKETVMTVMSGIDYDNRKEVIEARANGHAPINNAGLKWGFWLKGFEGYALGHTNKAGEYHEYIRLYPTYNKEHRINARTIYKVDGVIVKKEDLKALNLFNDSFFEPLGTDEEYAMLNYLLMKEQVQELPADESKELEDLRFKLMPQCFSPCVDNIVSIG